MLYVIRDWLPFALVLVAYDLSRGAARLIGRPTMWHWQIDAGSLDVLRHDPDGVAAGATEAALPAVVGRSSSAPSTCRSSSFRTSSPAVLWLRDRDEWKAFVQLFVGLSFAALIIYALLPAAPPWAAARCTAADVARRSVRIQRVHVPTGPRSTRTADCSARCRPHQDGANGWVERIVGRGWGKLNLAHGQRADRPGQASVNLVAAIPSLHAGLTAGGRGVPVDSRCAEMAAAAGGLRPRDGVHARATPRSTTSSTSCSDGCSAAVVLLVIQQLRILAMSDER